MYLGATKNASGPSVFLEKIFDPISRNYTNSFLTVSMLELYILGRKLIVFIDEFDSNLHDVYLCGWRDHPLR